MSQRMYDLKLAAILVAIAVSQAISSNESDHEEFTFWCKPGLKQVRSKFLGIYLNCSELCPRNPDYKPCEVCCPWPLEDPTSKPKTEECPPSSQPYWPWIVVALFFVAVVIIIILLWKIFKDKKNGNGGVPAANGHVPMSRLEVAVAPDSSSDAVEGGDTSGTEDEELSSVSLAAADSPVVNVTDSYTNLHTKTV